MQRDLAGCTALSQPAHRTTRIPGPAAVFTAPRLAPAQFLFESAVLDPCSPREDRCGKTRKIFLEARSVIQKCNTRQITQIPNVPIFSGHGRLSQMQQPFGKCRSGAPFFSQPLTFITNATPGIAALTATVQDSGVAATSGAAHGPASRPPDTTRRGIVRRTGPSLLRSQSQCAV
jgi:hypothetical protein